MQIILYIVIAIYSLPLIGVVFSFFHSDAFSLQSQIIYIVESMATTHLSLIRDTLGTIFVPLLAAFSIKIRSSEEKVPYTTICLIVVLAVFIVVSAISFGVIKAYEKRLIQFGQTVFNSYRDISLSYVREYLIYFAMTLGVGIPKKKQD